MNRRGLVKNRLHLGFTALLAATLLTFGLVPVASAAPVVTVSGTVSVDTNANGTLDAGEPGFGNATTVELICDAGGAVIGSATPGADGTWSISGVDAASCSGGTVKVKVTVNDNTYSITPDSGDNDTPRTSPQVGESATLTIADGGNATVDTLIRPDWYTNLVIPVDGGTGDPAVYTGSAPFDATCADPGQDCAANDLIVRTADTVTFSWSITDSSFEDLSATNQAVIFQQTLNLTDGAIANFARIPARCKPSGGGGATPASVIVDQDGNVIPEGAMPPAGTTSVTLKCNLGKWTQTGDAVLFQPVVKVSPTSPNGSSFDTVGTAYAVDANGIPTAVPSAEVPYGPIQITAAPAYELEKKGFFYQDPGYGDAGNGSEPGYYTYTVIQVKTNRRVGTEALKQPITVTDDLFSMLSDGATAHPGFKFAITQCIPNPSGWAGTVGGRSGPFGNFAQVNQTVLDSGTCTATRNDPSDPTSDYTLTFDEIDMSGARYPTKDAVGADLSAGPFYVASYRVQIFIPLSSIDAGDGEVGNDVGGLTLYNRVGDFDPDGVSGASNFGSGREPGWCDPMSVDGNDLNAEGMPFCDPSGTNTTTPAKSDNVAGPTSFSYSPGQFAKYLLDQTKLYNAGWQFLPNMTAPHDGGAVMQPGQVFDTHLVWINGNAPTWTDSRICDVFDNTMATLVPSTETVSNGDPNIYAWLSADGPGTGNYDYTLAKAYNEKWIFEFGHIDLPAGDDPLSGGLNGTTGRYDGTWTNQAAARCNDDATTWYKDPNSVPGGLEAVNAVRVRPGIDPATGELTTHDFGVTNRLDFGMRVRSTFNGGPHDGKAIPAGAVIANFGAVRSDQSSPNWTSRNYTPSPENTAYDGDRVTVSLAVPAIQKRTITIDGVGDGAADFGNTGAAVAGNQVVWEVVSSLQAQSQDPAPVQGVKITDVLPQYADYDRDCTAALPGGTPADVVLYDTPSAGQTTLIWNLGTWTPNTSIPNRRICTNTDPLAPNATSLVNHSEITFTGSPITPFDDHTVVLEQTGEVKLRKKVDAPLDVLNDDQKYTLSMQNFSDTLTIKAPTFIEVFPYNGDGSVPGGVNRVPASNYDGVLTLTRGEPTVADMAGAAYPGTFYYTTDAPGTINQNLNNNTSTWVPAAGISDWSLVTGFKFVGSQDLTPIKRTATSGLVVSFELQAGDTADPFSADANKANNVYSDRFTAFSDTFSNANGFQTLASNRVTVRTVSHTVGDLIFEDVNGNGAYDAGVDGLVPDGVTVNLFYVPESGSPVQVGSTTTTDGVYKFTQLPAGTYYVEIPASDFASGGKLDGWQLTAFPAAGTTEADVDENDTVSHDAISGVGGSVRSNQFVLSATVNPDTGSITGDEPTAENIHGVTDATTTDPFSNLAIDLALQRDPAIDVEKEVCTKADNSCDPDAALGEGGWSADDVAGNGPTTERAIRPYGSDVLWRIVVKNTGYVTLTDVEVTDPVTTACEATSADYAKFAKFAPGDVVKYTCKTTGITKGIEPNTAAVTGHPIGVETTVTDTDTANAVTTGSVKINKSIVGPGGQLFGKGPFKFTVMCTFDKRTVLDTKVTLTPAQGATSVTSEAFSGLPIGTNCTITETDNADADNTPAPVEVVIVENDQENTVIAQVSNAFSVAVIDVAKTVDGSGADLPNVVGKSFEVTVTCQIETQDEAGSPVIATLFSGPVTVKDGETIRVKDSSGNDVKLPKGAHCFAVETNTSGANSHTVNYDSFDNAAIVGSSEAEQVLTLSVTNTFDEAFIVIKKKVVGDTSHKGPFTFEVICAYPDGTAEVFPRFKLKAGQSIRMRVQAGAECVADEVGGAGSALVTIEDTDDTTVGGVDDGIVIADSEMDHTITVINKYVKLPNTGATQGANLASMYSGLGAAAIGALLLGVAVIRRRRRAL